MSDVELLLRSYWELLHERILADRDRVLAAAEEYLRRETHLRAYPGLREPDGFEAYLEAAEAFIDERIEAYNPVGVQYLFDRQRRSRAGELGFALDWYGGRHEYARLRDAAAEIVESGFDSDSPSEAAARLIHRCGAYPDESIISAYDADPAPHKLADYIVAMAIESLLKAAPPF
jgi:hypothetical protein